MQLVKEMDLARALNLAITAPTEIQAKRCIAMAAQISVGLTDEQVERCKTLALAM